MGKANIPRPMSKTSLSAGDAETFNQPQLSTGLLLQTWLSQTQKFVRSLTMETEHQPPSVQHSTYLFRPLLMGSPR